MKKIVFYFFERNFSFRSYFLGCLALVVTVAGIFAGLNYAADDFGLWHRRASVRLWALDKTSKHLLAHRYVPDNFEGILMGPSLSANIDTRLITTLPVFNLSMNGGNAIETGRAARLYIARARNPRLLIICLDPYLTQDSMYKSFQIHEKEYWGSLYSILPGIIWISKLRVALGRADEYSDSTSGWTQFEKRQPQEDIAAMRKRTEDLLAVPQEPNDPARIIDPVAAAELRELADMALARGMTVIAYHHPRYKPSLRLDMARGEWDFFRTEMRRILPPAVIIEDYNTAQFDYITDDDTMRLDGGHLNKAGAAAMGRELDRMVARYMGDQGR